MGCTMNQQAHALLSEVRDRYVERFWADPNVTGFGIGLLRGTGVRTAIGLLSLPGGSPVEVELVA